MDIAALIAVAVVVAFAAGHQYARRQNRADGAQVEARLAFAGEQRDKDLARIGFLEKEAGRLNSENGALAADLRREREQATATAADLQDSILRLQAATGLKADEIEPERARVEEARGLLQAERDLGIDTFMIPFRALQGKGRA